MKTIAKDVHKLYLNSILDLRYKVDMNKIKHKVLKEKYKQNECIL